MKNKFLKYPTKPYTIGSEDNSVYTAIKKLVDTSYQGRQLGHALMVYEKMLNDRVTIFFGLAGAMVPAGMREVIVYLINNNLIDCIVSTGANLFHDCFETLGYKHFKGTHLIDDVQLRKERIDRIYDTFADDKELEATDHYIMEFAKTLDLSRSYTTREFFYLFGEKLTNDARTEGIITAAFKKNVPIYCPAIADSSFGIALAILKEQTRKLLTFNLIEDVIETTKIVTNSPAVAEFLIGGGTPKNFIQQSEVTAFLMGNEVGGLKYAIQLTQDSPQWGGLSGCTFEEATSWGKISFDAKKAFVHVDATIGLPLIVTAISEVMKNKKRIPPVKFDISGQELIVKKNSRE